MMSRQLLRGYLSIGIFIGVGGILLALVHPPDSAEFVVSVCSGIIGLLLVAGAVLVSRLQDRDEQ